MSRKSMLITTTSSIDGAPIQRYNGIVSARVVTGTGLFSDFFADFTDVFGGRSNTYQNQLKSIYDEVISLLKVEASKANANAIIGVRIDHDEISGKGKQMFMVTATGTAVVVDDASIDQVEESTAPSEISLDKLEREIVKAKMIQVIRKDPSEIPEKMDFFIQNQVAEALEDIIDYYMNTAMVDYVRPKIVEYAASIEEFAKPYLYKRLSTETYPIKILLVIAEAKLLDYSLLNEFIHSMPFNIRKASLSYLMRPISAYTPKDLEGMEAIERTIAESFHDRGKALDSEKWECECGKVNKSGQRYCKSCGQDIRGFEEGQTLPEQVLGYLHERQQVLKRIFNA